MKRRSGPAPPGAAAGPSADPVLARQLRWLIGIRLVVITSVVVPYFLLQLSWRLREAALLPEGAPEGLLPSLHAVLSGPDTSRFLYLLSGLTYLASLLYLVLLKVLRGHHEAQAYVQFVGDLLLVTGLVFYFGGISSPFSIFYLIVISVAATLLRRGAGVIVGTVAWCLYAGTALALHFDWLASPAGAEVAAAGVWRLAYSLGIHLFGFYAVALLTSQLAHTVTRAEEELEVKREHLADLQVVHQDVIESISSGLVTTDLEARVTSVNRAGREILGMPREELVGEPIFRAGLFSADSWQEFTRRCRDQERIRDEVPCWRENGLRHIGFTLTPLDNADGEQTGYIVIFQDLTEWRALREELRIKDRMAAVGELASGIAHEIGNPLAAISGSVQLLSGSLAPTSPQTKLLEILLKESQRLDRTIKGFLQFARPKERSSVPFDIAHLLSEHVALLQNSDEVSKRHAIELELDPAAATIIADPDQVSQIFWNLARNALRAMPRGGTLQVRGELDGATYRIQFTDNGRGMSEEERANLFHPFHSFFDGGTGIGMAIVYRIVEEHRGRLAVSSLPGQGTTIVVELPAAAVSALPAGVAGIEA